MNYMPGGVPRGLHDATESPESIKAALDARRVRKSMTRRTIDHCASIIQYLEDSAVGDRPLRSRLFTSLQPAVPSILNVCFASPLYLLYSSHFAATHFKCLLLALRELRLPFPGTF